MVASFTASNQIGEAMKKQDKKKIQLLTQKNRVCFPTKPNTSSLCRDGQNGLRLLW